MIDDPSGQPLALCTSLFEQLNTEGLRYCHWKSNIRLEKSLRGETDLDILVAPADLGRFLEALRRQGFRPMINPPEKVVDGLSDFLGFDHCTGKLVHVHLHDRLVLGSLTDKSIELPMEDLFWSNLETRSNIPIPVPPLELMVLLLRAFLKATPSRTAKPIGWFPADIVDEVGALYQASDKDRFLSFVNEAGLKLRAESLLGTARLLAEGRADRQLFLKLYRQVRKELRPFRCRRGWRDLPNRVRRAFYAADWTKRHLPKRRKRLSEIGLSIALIGADGSGKTTISKALARWLQQKLVCQQAYLGLPKSSHTYHSLLRLEKWGAKRQRASSVADVARMTRWLWSAIFRLWRARQIKRATERGTIVVCDRYPLEELVGENFSMDGARIRHEFRGRFELFATLEDACYSRMPRPDLAIVLRTSIPELQRRRSELPTDVIEKKAALIERIPPGPRIEVIDNDRDLECVLRDIKRAIWSHLDADHSQAGGGPPKL